jgi:preprotein translocase subunit SecG
MVALKPVIGAMLSVSGGGRGSGGAGALLTRSFALLAALLLASAVAAGQAAPAPSLPDPCEMAPNLPYCP